MSGHHIIEGVCIQCGAMYTDWSKPCSCPDDFSRALDGDERAMLRHMIRSLSHQMAMLITFKEIPHALRVSSKNLAVAAIEFLDGEGDRT
jgi:hypothetical protein